MTSTARPSRASAGIALLVAGALLALGVVLALAGIPLGPWPNVLAWIAVGVGFVLLVRGPVAVVARLAFLAGALGWFLLALDETGLGLPAAFTLIAALLAALGGVVGAVAFVVRKELDERVRIALLVTAILAAVLLVGALAGLPLAELALGLTLAFAAGLVVTGVLLRGTSAAAR